MSRPRRWSDLVVGVLALVGVIGAATAVLVFARVGALHGRTMGLYATVSGARGLSSGSEVWLGGQRVGLVRGIRFRPPTADTTQPLLLELQVLADDRALIRRDATVDVHPGGNLIGAPIVAISFGRPGSPEVRDGDTLRSAVTEDVDRVRTEFAAAGEEAPLIIANVKLLASQLRAARGTLGALGVDGMPNVGGVGARVGALRANVTRSDGTIGLAMRGGALEARAHGALASADSVRTLLTTSESTSLGRFRRDSTLFVTIGAVRTELADVARQMSATTGSIGRSRQDSALAKDLARMRSELTALMADVKRHPLRYLNASSF